MKQYIKQINNLKIYFTDWFQYCVITPDKIILEDRMTLEQAETFCKNTKDYILYKEVIIVHFGSTKFLVLHIYLLLKRVCKLYFTPNLVHV